MKVKRSVYIAILLLISLSALSMYFFNRNSYKKYSSHFLGTFDTIISFTAYSNSQENFNKEFNIIKDKFTYYHKLFDIYNEYDNVVNIFKLNQSAYKKPIKINDDLFEFLSYCIDLQKKYNTGISIAMGPVLNIWHEYREDALNNKNYAIPSKDELEQAFHYVDINNIVLDSKEKTVLFLDKNTKIDVGAIAKGYATQKVAEYLNSSGLKSYILNAGGNIQAGAKPLDNRNYWSVGIADPNNPNKTIDSVYLKNKSIVTSGIYQRYYELDGVKYHHIIDPKTLFPSTMYKGLTVICEDSAIADFLSTSLFIMDIPSGEALLKELNACAYYVSSDDKHYYINGFEKYAKSKGASQNSNIE